MDVLATSYLLLFFIIATGLLLIGHFVEKIILSRRHGWVKLLVLVPQGLINPFAEHKPHEINQSAELYRRLSEFNIPFSLETAVHSMGEEIHFYISVPVIHLRKTVRLIESLWPTGFVTPAEDYELWLAATPEASNHTGVGYLAQSRPYCIPLKRAHKGHFEPFLGVLKHLSGLAAVGEAAAIQWTVRKADPRLTLDIGNHLQKFHRGEYHPSRHVHEKFILTPETIKSLETKVRSPLFAVNCRIITAASAGDATEILKRLASHFEAGSTTGDQENSFKLIAPKHPEKVIEDFFARHFEPSQEMILTAEELATYFHLPSATTAVPKIKRKK
jgi:hypothetical protein